MRLGAGALCGQTQPLTLPLHPFADIQHTEAQLSSALKELELIRHQEERMLEQRVAELQRGHASRMASLERRFLSDAEALQVSMHVPFRRTSFSNP